MQTPAFYTGLAHENQGVCIFVRPGSSARANSCDWCGIQRINHGGLHGPRAPVLPSVQTSASYAGSSV